MTRPIPKRMLRSAIEVRVPIPGGYGGAYEDAVTIAPVCFDSAASLTSGIYQNQAPVKGVVFIDAVNSEGAFEIPAGSLVRVDGEDAESCVRSCKPCRDGLGRVHHWEVELA